MIKLINNGTYFVDGKFVDSFNADKNIAKQGTMTYKILNKHNTSDNPDLMKIKFDALVSHDITYVGIIQTARASGLKEFHVPYALTNCHNSLCAVGGTINEDDHVFGLSAAKKYGGIYVPANQAVIHQFAREKLAKCGNMILGSDSHTRYGALGVLAVGEGGPELVKQLLNNTYDITPPSVLCVYLHGKPRKGIGPHDVALALIKAVFQSGFAKNKVLEFVGDGIKNLSADFRLGIDVMTTETACLSSIWQTDDIIRQYYVNHLREDDFCEIMPDNVCFYDGVIDIDLDKVEPMIALPFHPSNTYTIREFIANAETILSDIDDQIYKTYGKNLLNLKSKVKNGNVFVDQGIIAGCAGGTFENLCVARDILKGGNIGNGAFNLSVYPSSTPVQAELFAHGIALDLLNSGAVLKPAFCGPCFGAGDVPQNNGLSIRHTTRNFPMREGSKPANGQLSAVALMDARSIATTALNGGILTPADEVDFVQCEYDYKYNPSIYQARVYDGFGKPDETQELVFGPNIADWPKIPEAKQKLLLRLTAVIHDEVTTTDELIPSGETSSYRSNPLKLAEFALSRRVPEYVSRCKQLSKEIEENSADLNSVLDLFNAEKQDCNIASVIYATKPGDGSAREQASSCQRVLGGGANICREFATKRYRSNCINWGMLPMVVDKDFTLQVGDYIFVEDVFALIDNQEGVVKTLSNNKIENLKISLGSLTAEEKEILKRGCLMNYYAFKNNSK